MNTSDLDCIVTLSPDGQTLYLSSERPGGLGGPYGDIYQAPILPIGDFNGNGKVAIEDLALLIDNWGQSKPLCDIGPMPWGDGTNRRLYVDDTVMAEDTQAGNLAECSGRLNFGCENGIAPGSFFCGLIDNVCVCNRAAPP